MAVDAWGSPSSLAGDEAAMERARQAQAKLAADWAPGKKEPSLEQNMAAIWAMYFALGWL